MARKRRQFEVFSMSFLDCMSCGFGAVILFFMIINAQVRETTEDDPDNLMAETKKLEIEILDGRKDLVLAKNTVEQLDTERDTAEGQIAQIIALIQQLQAELAQYDNETIAKVERVEQLESDIKSLQEEVKRLLAMAAEQQAQGTMQREFQGDGDRQYLTGLKLRGRHTLILVDRSASMLDDTIVNIIRRRNMPQAPCILSTTGDWATEIIGAVSAAALATPVAAAPRNLRRAGWAVPAVGVVLSVMSVSLVLGCRNGRP
jgi:hypothetical protein